MRFLALVTYTPDCENKWRSLRALGHHVVVEQYDDRPHDRHRELVDLARALRPDAVVYVGAIEKYHGRPVPSPDVLRALRDVAPTVHVCGDASDRPWWDLLHAYENLDVFSCQVSIDGSRDTPIASYRNGLVRLTPTDPTAFAPVPWGQRRVFSGFAGGRGHGDRSALLDALRGRAGMTWASPSSYDEMAMFLCGCRVVANSPMNGSGTGTHVKGRVVEAGFAGACLLEQAGCPTQDWFRPGIDYLTYVDVEDAIEKVTWARSNEAEVRAMAANFHARMAIEHHPRVFWRDVLATAGINGDV